MSQVIIRTRPNARSAYVAVTFKLRSAELQMMTGKIAIELRAISTPAHERKMRSPKSSNVVVATRTKNRLHKNAMSTALRVPDAPCTALRSARCGKRKCRPEAAKP